MECEKSLKGRFTNDCCERTSRIYVLRVQEVRWDRGGTKSASEYTFCYGKNNENYELGRGLFVHNL
jgi:hypothetical protein